MLTHSGNYNLRTRYSQLQCSAMMRPSWRSKMVIILVWDRWQVMSRSGACIVGINRVGNNFIIIIDMSSGSLISSLFRDNSFASRSNSMFHKSFLGTENKQERSRSQSVYPNNNPNNPTSKYLPVARMTHMLAVKIKKLNYFLFCRLEANLKKLRAEEAQLNNHNHVIEAQIEQIPKVPIPNKLNQKAERLAKGLQALAEIFQLNELKRQTSSLQNTFKKIKIFSKNTSACSAIFKILVKNYRSKLSTSFKSIHDRQKFLLRAQIFSQANVHVFQPKFKELFKKIRQFAIDNKIRMQMQDRLKKEQQRGKYINMDEFYLGMGNTRLKSISEEGSSILSEEETARFTTPEKFRCKKGKDYAQEFQKSKTSRKQPRNLVLTKKQTRKDYDDIEKEEFQEVLKSNVKNQQESQTKNKSHSIRASTKKQPQKTKITFGKSCKIETCLYDPNVIMFSKADKFQEKECMLKHNRLYAESWPHMVPDLHDNMGVFEQMWAEECNPYSEQALFSHRTADKNKSQWTDIQSSKTTNLCKVAESKAIVVEEDPQQVQLYELRHTESFNIKQNSRNNVTACSRAMTNSLSSPKFCIETGINTHLAEDELHRREERRNFVNNQFYSSPLCKIEEMMVDLEKLREREKYTSKYVSGYQKCKLSVNLPKKSYEGRSYQVSASKTNINSSKTGLTECRSQKKNQNKEPFKRFSCKQNKQQKQNIEVKLWQEKQKFLFYAEPKQMKQRKKSSGLISSMNQSQINTARKMKKEIENIINNRKSRTSLGGLKLVKSKY